MRSNPSAISYFPIPSTIGDPPIARDLHPPPSLSVGRVLPRRAVGVMMMIGTAAEPCRVPFTGTEHQRSTHRAPWKDAPYWMNRRPPCEENAAPQPLCPHEDDSSLL